jgi:hypothetical protein
VVAGVPFRPRRGHDLTGVATWSTPTSAGRSLDAPDCVMPRAHRIGRFAVLVCGAGVHALETARMGSVEARIGAIPCASTLRGGRDHGQMAGFVCVRSLRPDHAAALRPRFQTRDTE